MRVVLLLLSLTPVIWAQQAITVRNAASGFRGIAPGSLMEVDLDLRLVTGGITPLELSTVSVQIGGIAASVVARSQSPIGVLALVPKGLPLGPAAVVMNYNGLTSAPVTVELLASSFGLYLTPNRLTAPAKPGDYLTLWGTGLGAATPDQVTVLLGGVPIPPTYAAADANIAGLDQINFQIPADPAIPQGCYVAVAVQAAGVSSNFGVLSLSADGSPCSSPFGLTNDQLGRLDAGGSVYLGQVNLYDLMLSAMPARMDSADALVLALDAANLAQLVDPLTALGDGCRSVAIVAARFIGTSGALSMGPQVTLFSPTNKLDLPLESPDFPTLYRSNATTPFDPGPWRFAAPGSTDLPAFTLEFTVPPPVHPAVLAQNDGLNVTWNGTDYPEGFTANIQLSGAALVSCRAPGEAGQLTIPSALLRSGPATVSVLIAPRPDRLQTFQVPRGNGDAIPFIVRSYTSQVVPLTVP